MSFEDRLVTGSLGERMVDEFLRQKGWIPYYPTPGVAHPFDRLVASSDKKRLCIVEVKTKWHREAYRDTGIDQKHYDDYLHITTTYSVPLFLAFVDSKEGQIYGDWWHDLLKPRLSQGREYPWIQKRIVYFPLPMRTLYVMRDDERAELLSHRTSNWKPEPPTMRLATPPLNVGCIHRAQFKANGRCWICDHM